MHVRVPIDVLALAERQAGLVHYDQLASHGVARWQLRSRLGTEWRAVLPRVVTTTLCPLDERQRLVAALLYAGTGAMITGAAAARWHGITAAQQALVPIEVPHSRRPRGGGFVDVRRTLRPDPHPWQHPPLILVSRQRAVVVAARDCRTERDATAVVIEAVQRRLVRLEDVRSELEAGPRAGSARLRRAVEPSSRRAVEAAERGAWSVPEADLAALVRTSSVLPEMWANPRCAAAQSGCPRRTAGSTTWHWPSRPTRGSTTPGNSTGRRPCRLTVCSPSTASHSSPSPLGRSSTMHARSSSGWSGPTSRRRSAPRPTVVATRRSVA